MQGWRKYEEETHGKLKEIKEHLKEGHEYTSSPNHRWRRLSAERPMSRLVCRPKAVKALQTQQRLRHPTTTPPGPPLSHWSCNQWYIILTVTWDHHRGAYTSTGTITTHYRTIWHSPSGCHQRPKGGSQAGDSDWYALLVLAATWRKKGAMKMKRS